MIGALPRATLLIGEGSVRIRRPNAPCDANERVASVEPAECRAVQSGTCDVCLTGRGHSARAANKLYTNNWRLVCLHTPVSSLSRESATALPWALPYALGIPLYGFLYTALKFPFTLK